MANNSFDIDYIKSIGLEVVEIMTENGEIPTCDYISGPEGTIGITSTNQNKVPCRIIITLHNDTLYDSGHYQKDVSGATIRINGNTSGIYHNKPYKLKLQKKADLLTRNDSKFFDKDWRLIKDPFKLTTIIGLKLNEMIGLQWTPRYKPCNVFINGDYQGCYLLIESTKRNKDCRLNVDKNTGYIMERDPYWWNEDKYFKTDFFYLLYYRWTWKYPKDDTVTQEQEDYIKSYIEKVESSILSESNYEDYIDVESFAKWLMAHDMLGTMDSGGSNLFVTKYDNSENTKLEMGNMWDFDSSFILDANNFSYYHDRSFDFYYPELLNNKNKAFYNTYKQLWNDRKDDIFNQLTTFISDYPDTDEGKALQLSMIENNKRWNIDNSSVSQYAENAVAWLTEHWKFMEKEINKDTKINYVTLEQDVDNLHMFTLDGKKITHTQKGSVIIRGHKKYIYR